MKRMMEEKRRGRRKGEDGSSRSLGASSYPEYQDFIYQAGTSGLPVIVRKQGTIVTAMPNITCGRQ
jgi:hypothetical protein